MHRRALIASLALAAPALAQPTPPLRIVVPQAPGGSTDTLARLLAPGLAQRLGAASAAVENRPGGNAAIGAAAVAQAAPDGATLLLDAVGPASNPALLRNLPLDYERDLAPVAQLTTLPLVLVVRAADGPRDLAALLALIRAEPRRASYGTSGIGTGQHLAIAILLRRAGGLEATHIPYRGAAPQVTALLAGETLFSFLTLAGAAAQVAEGRLRALAVSTPERAPSHADVPTMAEQGFPGFAWLDFHGMLAPAATPAPVLERVAAAAREALAEPALAARLPAMGLLPSGTSPAEFRLFLARQRRLYAEVAAAEGIRVEG